MEISLKVVHLLSVSTLGFCMQLPDSFFNQNSYDFDAELESAIENESRNDNLLERCFCLPNSSNTYQIEEEARSRIRGRSVERLVIYIYKSNGKLYVFIPNKQKQGMIPNFELDEINGDVFKPVKYSQSIGKLYDESDSVIKRRPSLIMSEEIASGVIETEFDANEENLNADFPKGIESNIKGYVLEHGDFPDDYTPVVDDSSSLNEDQPGGEQDELQDNIHRLPITNEALINSLTDSKKTVDTKYLRQVLSMLPPQLKLYLETLLTKLPNPHVRFNDWFQERMMHIVLQNSTSPVVLRKIKESILAIFKNNGLHLSWDGYLVDSKGRVYDMNNIKLRSILIGDVVQYRKLLNYHLINKRLQPIYVPYHQMILITLVKPPTVLGLVPVGRVHIPRYINEKKDILMLNELDEIDINTGTIFPKDGIPDDEVSKNGDTEYEEVYVVRQQAPITDLDEQPLERFSYDIKDLGKAFNDALGILGTPNFLVAPNRRILGGYLQKDSKPSTQWIPDFEDLGVRIVGGRPATTSGTPIVSKGRSGILNNVL